MKTLKLKNPSGTKQIVVGAGQSLRVIIKDVEKGSRDFKLELIIKGENAFCEILGILNATNKDEKKWDVTQNLQGVNQKAEIDVRAVGEDDSRIEVNARGILTKESVNGEVNIAERVILFGKAKAKALPVLRVETDKVAAASHGASVAPISPDQIFYAQSRGITAEDAKEMIKKGFLQFDKETEKEIEEANNLET